MARIVLGIGSSHTPMLALPADEWLIRAKADYENPKLNLSDGRMLSYQELLADTPRLREVKVEALAAQAESCQRALDRLADALEAAKPDVVLIVGDDQQELFDASNQPAIAIYWGDLVRTHSEYEDEGLPDWVKRVGDAYLMSEVHELRGAPELGFELIRGLIQRGIDVGSCADVKDPKAAGFGHAFGFIAKRIMKEKDIPVLPILLNTYYPPNVPTARRCHEIGLALRDAILSSKTSAKVAIVASGGLSHFVVDEALDRRVLAGLRRGAEDILKGIEESALNSGSSEILNWVMVSAAVSDLPFDGAEYHPIYRTPAGTGVGVCFATWGAADRGGPERSGEEA